MNALFGASLTTADRRMTADGHAVRIILTISLISKDLQKSIFRIAKGQLTHCGRCSFMARKASFRNGEHDARAFQSEKLVKQHDFYAKTTGVLKKAYNFANVNAIEDDDSMIHYCRVRLDLCKSLSAPGDLNKASSSLMRDG